MQYLLPQHSLSHLAGWLAEIRAPWFKNFFIKQFIKAFHIDMRLAKIEDPTAYACFNSFFIRELKPELRPITPAENALACPADGTIAQIGLIADTKLLQAKGSYFMLDALLANDTQLVNLFKNGSFTTIYLAPNDYHRVHMPATGKLIKTIFVPGKLFSVNDKTAGLVPNLYSRNERFICHFETAQGPMTIILVGAMIVGSIQTVWMKKPARTNQVQLESYLDQNIVLAKGAELGYFNMGSTAIILFGQNMIEWSPSLQPSEKVIFGQFIGNFPS